MPVLSLIVASNSRSRGNTPAFFALIELIVSPVRPGHKHVACYRSPAGEHSWQKPRESPMQQPVEMSPDLSTVETTGNGLDSDFTFGLV
jgi:hypothetical protein